MTSLTLFFISGGTIVLGQEIQSDKENGKLFKHWSHWQIDTIKTNQVIREVIKKKYRYRDNKIVKISIKYDQCGYLVRKTKSQRGGNTICLTETIKYDKEYHSDCEDTKNEIQ